MPVEQEGQLGEEGNVVERLSASISEFNAMLSEIAFLEMRLLFKKAKAQMMHNFTSMVKQKYGLELAQADKNHHCAKVLQESLSQVIADIQFTKVDASEN